MRIERVLKDSVDSPKDLQHLQAIVEDDGGQSYHPFIA